MIRFGVASPEVVEKRVDNTPFKLSEKRSNQAKVHEVKDRPGQQRFKYVCLKRYGARCAVCGIGHGEVLDAAHLKAVSEGGSDDPRNGLILCSLHHRALDAYLYGIEPTSLKIRIAPGVHSREALKLENVDICHLKSFPHTEAVSWLWARFEKKHKF